MGSGWKLIYIEKIVFKLDWSIVTDIGFGIKLPYIKLCNSN